MMLIILIQNGSSAKDFKQSLINRAEKTCLVGRSSSEEHYEGEDICLYTIRCPDCPQGGPLSWFPLPILYSDSGPGRWLTSPQSHSYPALAASPPLLGGAVFTQWACAWVNQLLRHPFNRQRLRCSGSLLKANACLKIICSLPEKAALPC